MNGHNEWVRNLTSYNRLSADDQCIWTDSHQLYWAAGMTVFLVSQCESVAGRCCKRAQTQSSSIKVKDLQQSKYRVSSADNSLSSLSVPVHLPTPPDSLSSVLQGKPGSRQLHATIFTSCLHPCYLIAPKFKALQKASVTVSLPFLSSWMTPTQCTRLMTFRLTTISYHYLHSL